MAPAILIFLFFFGGCTWMNKPMTAIDMKTAINECRQAGLNVLVYERPDQSVIDIRCIPKESDTDETVILRPKIPVNILKPIIYEVINAE